ncbi:hypothetical protein K1718_26585 [Roseibium porphyridii]|uniref:Uncharacterized protein n=1 Tax=Roseibium porphyridii TaxID=2866279 RepID=A0ABY8F5G0_9HYPH|nr:MULTISPECIES: hypothetical protein [Stappiaceae]QFT34716.1 hypothetical protein FIV00_29745 [Labrenzia sp. THAF82]WFE89679.1 hypothetical protein K1718_26585 [Roseibium sp. KMA01]
MRLLSTGVAALALTAFAIVPASACSWGKTAKSKNMTVADTTVIPEVDTDVSIATNDLSDETLEEAIVLPVPGDKPAE